MYCKHCGRQVDDNSIYCPYCGKRLILTNQYGEEKEQREKEDIRNHQIKSKSKSRTNKNTKFPYPWGLVILILLAILGSLIFVLLSQFGGDIPWISRFLRQSGNKSENKSLYDNYIPPADTVTLDAEKQIYYVENELLVIFSGIVTDNQVKEVVTYLNGEIAGIIPELGMYQIILPNAASIAQIELIANDLMGKYDFVRFATYDTATFNANDDYVPNDPWDKDVNREDWTDSDVDGSNWWAEAIDARGAWKYNDDLSFINIGVCDSSFDSGHEDLKNKCEFANELLKNRNDSSQWWSDFNRYTWDRDDQENSHGTHVAGIIGAESDNKKGITGLVKNCKLLLAPYYRDPKADVFYSFDSATYANLAYLVKAGAKVINFSQGKTNFLTSNIPLYSQDFITREGDLAAICVSKLLEEEKDKDFVIVQSAGNGLGRTGVAMNAIQNGWFASVTDSSLTWSENISISDVRDRIIIVGAVEQHEKRYRCTSYSNYGEQVDIFAPGDNIYSTYPGDTFWMFEFNGGYEYLGGTSMAAPIVTGVCALVWAADQSLTRPEVKRIVCQNTADIVQTNPKTQDTSTYKMANAKLAVEKAIDHKTVWKVIKDPEKSLKPYRAVIGKLSSQYGELQIKTKEQNCHEAYGLCYLKLLDFTGDGIEELFAVGKKENEEHYHGYIYTLEGRKAKCIFETDHIEYSPYVNCYDVIYISYTEETGYIFGTGWEADDAEDRTFYYYDGKKITQVYRSRGYWDNQKREAVMYENDKVVDLFDDLHRDQTWGNASSTTLRTFYSEYDLHWFDEEAIRNNISEVKNRLITETS